MVQTTIHRPDNLHTFLVVVLRSHKQIKEPQFRIDHYSFFHIHLNSHVPLVPYHSLALELEIQFAFTLLKAGQ